MKKIPHFTFFFLFTVLSINSHITAQTEVSLSDLKIDTLYRQINYYNLETAKKLKQYFDQLDSSKLVFFHFGGSHIQAEIPTSKARENFIQTFSDGGRGMIFPYNVAKTYSSINYTTYHTGNWSFAKSFQTNPKIPLGVCGMAVNTSENNASIQFNFKKPLLNQSYKLLLLLEVDSLTPEFSVKLDSATYFFSKQQLIQHKDENYLEIHYTGAINHLKITLSDSNRTNVHFQFYGIDVELNKPNGIVYHSLGVGAAPFRSVLNIAKLEEHAKILQPDVILLDFGTNDILYKNQIDTQLASQVEETILKLRKINPDVLIVLTSTQDLYYKKKLVTATIAFRDLMDSLAKKNHCLFWNWLDLSGGIETIKKWHQLGYAQKDLIHLTMNGYKVKGQLLYESFIKTLNYIKLHPNQDQYAVAMKSYDKLEVSSFENKETDLKEPKESVTQELNSTPIYYTVKDGDTLSDIAEKNGISLLKLKEMNHLKKNIIKKGQILKIN